MPTGRKGMPYVLVALFPEEKNHPAQFSFNKNSALLCLECAQMAGSRDKVGINVALQPKPEP